MLQARVLTSGTPDKEGLLGGEGPGFPAEVSNARSAAPGARRCRHQRPNKITFEPSAVTR